MDIIKVVGMALKSSDTFILKSVVDSLNVSTPVIAILAGEKGRLSRVVNRFMTPVTHPFIPLKAAPGQLSVTQIKHYREALSL